LEERDREENSAGAATRTTQTFFIVSSHKEDKTRHQATPSTTAFPHLYPPAPLPFPPPFSIFHKVASRRQTTTNVKTNTTPATKTNLHNALEWNGLKKKKIGHHINFHNHIQK